MDLFDWILQLKTLVWTLDTPPDVDGAQQATGSSDTHSPSLDIFWKDGIAATTRTSFFGYVRYHSLSIWKQRKKQKKQKKKKKFIQLLLLLIIIIINWVASKYLFKKKRIRVSVLLFCLSLHRVIQNLFFHLLFYFLDKIRLCVCVCAVCMCVCWRVRAVSVASKEGNFTGVKRNLRDFFDFHHQTILVCSYQRMCPHSFSPFLVMTNDEEKRTTKKARPHHHPNFMKWKISRRRKKGKKKKTFVLIKRKWHFD